ncbi:hypothetical protein GCM10022140_43730 [Rhodococcus aetherivorans]
MGRAGRTGPGIQWGSAEKPVQTGQVADYRRMRGRAVVIGDGDRRRGSATMPWAGYRRKKVRRATVEIFVDQAKTTHYLICAWWCLPRI